MTTQFFSLVVLLFSFACNSDRKEKQVLVADDDSMNIKIETAVNIRFDFTATRSKTNSDIVEVAAEIYNDNTDTVYFLTYTCAGDQYALHYDTTRFALNPFMMCNAMFPKKQHIAPKGYYEFPAHFSCVKNEKDIKLGFEFCQVDKAFSISTENFNKIRSSSKENEEQLVIWANIKVIK